LAKEGATVVLNSSRTPFDGAVVASEANDAGGEAIYVQADVSQEGDVEQIAQLIEDRFGRIDIVVHSAADGLESRTQEVDWSDFERTFRTNSYALVSLARSLGPLMGKGKMLYISSFGAERAVPGYGVVGASKAAGEALVRSLAMELAPAVQVNGVRPAILPTVSLRAFSLADEFLEMAEREAPMGRGSIENVVDCALFLCSSEADFITGQVVPVDGGMGTTVFRKSWVSESA
jgi:enoyl-[acyl-carrier protein] reductase III